MSRRRRSEHADEVVARWIMGMFVLVFLGLVLTLVLTGVGMLVKEIGWWVVPAIIGFIYGPYLVGRLLTPDGAE